MPEFNFEDDWPWVAGILTAGYVGFNYFSGETENGNGGGGGQPEETYTLTIDTVGNGKVDVYAAGQKLKTCSSCSVDINRAATVELVPKPDQGNELDYWSDTPNFTIRTDKSITAYFQPSPSGEFPHGLTESQWNKIQGSVYDPLGGEKPLQDFVRPPWDPSQVPRSNPPFIIGTIIPQPKDPYEVEVFLKNAEQESVVLKWPDHSNWKEDVSIYAENIAKLAEFNQVKKIQWNSKMFWQGMTYDQFIDYLGG